MSITISRPRPARRAKLSGANTTPTNFDPARHPIISRHWFGVEPLRSIGQIAAEVVADLRFRRKVIRLHRQGPRAVGEFLAELGADRGIATVIDQKIDTYVELGAGALEAAGGDEFWQPPLHGVGR